MNTTKIFCTSDFHLGETRMQLMARPFKNEYEMFDTLLRNYNEVVQKDDLVYMVGDICYNPQRLDLIKEFNGRKILLRGNWDRVFTDAQLEPYFDTIVPEGESAFLDVAGIPCCINHYPSLARKDYFNLVGHIHAAWKFQLNSLNVGVDVHHYRPVDLEKQVPFYLKAISEFYDEDVWTAYAEANASYRETRGKKSNYFTAK